jgi:hypothetical protein
VDADERDPVAIIILFDDLVGDPDQRPPEIVVVEHDVVVHLRSFLASLDLVKGAAPA